ncbi:MAG: P1 family peptidase [Candidatus Lindowbacteria bacterium]|nr:P1 family peptidase [Candidatus Lindowbacteria bacterium]
MKTERCRAREFGLVIGSLQTGPNNAITDVPGVRVGHCSVVKGEGRCKIGEGPIRTGVTAILPASDDLFLNKVQAAVHIINGFGKSIGLLQVAEVGTIETPILITNTLNVSKVADGLLDYLIMDNGLDAPSINPVVMECNDFYLSDIWGRHVGKAEVVAAIEGASNGLVTEGSVGAGTGTAAYGFKGGVGTSSRIVLCGDQGFTVGALVVTNMGKPEQLKIGGVPVGRKLIEQGIGPALGGSIIMVLATDAPLSVNQLRRVAARATHGLARTGSYSGNTSGDIVLAFSIARRIPLLPEQPVLAFSQLADNHIDSFFTAAADAIEESILNAMFMAETVVGRNGHTLHALPLDKVKALLG